jgi:hypothetical protein
VTVRSSALTVYLIFHKSVANTTNTKEAHPNSLSNRQSNPLQSKQFTSNARRQQEDNALQPFTLYDREFV